MVPNSDHLAISLACEFFVPWNVEQITQDFETKKSAIIPTESDSPAFWQIFPSGVSFARNFYSNYSSHCEGIASQLSQLQHRWEQAKSQQNSNPLLHHFLHERINSRRVNLIKIGPGINVAPHADATRNYAINIGLKNSNFWQTHIWHGTDT